MATELDLQLDDVIRTALAMRDALARGERVCLADARMLRGQAQCAEHLVELDHLRVLRGAPAATSEQDARAQVDMASGHHRRADSLDAAGRRSA